MSNSDTEKLIETLTASMKIRLFPFDASASGSQIRAYAELDFGGVFKIRGIKVIESKNGGLFIGFPSIRSRKDEYKDVFILNNRTFANIVRRRILDVFQNHGLE